MYCRVNFYQNELFSSVLSMTVLLPSHTYYNYNYKRCAVQCAAFGINLRLSIFYDFYESLEQENIKRVIGFQRRLFKSLMFSYSITSTIQKLFSN